MGAKVEELFVLVIGKRKVKIFGLPENFDEELFKAIDDLVNAREERCDIDHDSDPEVEAEMLDVIAELVMALPKMSPAQLDEANWRRVQMATQGTKADKPSRFTVQVSSNPLALTIGIFLSSSPLSVQEVPHYSRKELMQTMASTRGVVNTTTTLVPRTRKRRLITDEDSGHPTEQLTSLSLPFFFVVEFLWTSEDHMDDLRGGAYMVTWGTTLQGDKKDMMQNPWEIVMMKSLDFAVKGVQWMAGACHNFYNNVKVKEEAVGKKMWLSQKLHHTLGLLSEYETKQCNL